MLRYYQGQEVKQIGTALGLSENTAAKRLSRALDRLRQNFAERGVALSATAGVEALLVEMAKPAPPPALGESISNNPAAPSAAAEGVMRMMKMAHMKSVAAIAASICFAIAATVVVAVSLLSR